MVLPAGILFLSFVGHVSTLWLVPAFSRQFMQARICGVDMNKVDKYEIPEAAGVIAGCVYLMITIIMLPISFATFDANIHIDVSDGHMPYTGLVLMLSALLSIACMLLLGFADDVLDLKWRHKLILPTISCLPVLLVYFVTTNQTGILVPFFLRPSILEMSGGVVQLGIFYYIYIGMLAVFCTNAINIFSGINGLEVGQSVLIGIAVAIFNIIECTFAANESIASNHRLSLYFILPYIGTASALFKLNSYPASVFVGDTFCYFSGMTLAVVAILGHFSKTLLLFFVPQIVNFLYSLPQLFRLIPCPRHRLPRLNAKTGLLECSTFVVDIARLSTAGKWWVKILLTLNLIHTDSPIVPGRDSVQMGNLTLINLFLHWFGPQHERVLMTKLLTIQTVSLFLAFIVRYPVTSFIYSFEPSHMHA